jgi:hypothetical protein
VVKVYAIALTVGVLALIGWIFAVYVGNERASFNPDQRFGLSGRRVVAGLVGFGMAGMSAEFSPRDLSWPIALGYWLLRVRSRPPGMPGGSIAHARWSDSGVLLVSDVHGAFAALRRIVDRNETLLILGDLINLLD